MRCSKCGSDNRVGAKFCKECASPLSTNCPACGALNQPGAKFCDECGAALVDGAQATVAEATPTVVSAAGERRHLTMLFCDLVGSTEIAAQLDPEEWRETVAGYQRAAAEAITRFDGHVAKYLGDGVMAFFGYPEAHDNDAERAARAGLAILDAIAKLNEQSGRQKLSARVGIDSGAVVVGAGAGKETDVFGDAPNIAARVEAAAEPGTVMITDAVHRLVSGLFVVEDRGAQPLKGIERPTQLYRVIQPSGVRGRLEAGASAHGLTPFVGREDELRSLVNRWERVLEGEGQVALIVGEAGIGKSRLVQRFHEHIADTAHTWIEAGAGPFFQNTPFHPISEALRRLVWGQSFDRLDNYLRDPQTNEKVGREDARHEDQPVSEQLAQLGWRLTMAGLDPVEALPLLVPLLGLPMPAQYTPSALSPEQQRRRLLAVLIEWVLGAARVQPMVLAIEDLHWADPSTLELIQLLVEQGARSRLLLLYTARPEFRAEWPLRAHHTQITLDRLSARNVREMIAQVAARNALASETVDAVIERTSGVPLFVEELTRSVLESGTRLAHREIPVTLHDSLMARLDRLGPAKEVAQVGAVIGSEFSYELLHAVHPIAEEDLQRTLRSLTDAELLYVRGIAPDAIYQFKHALIRDAAYEALLKSRRKELHRQVALTIDGKLAVLKEAHPEVLARHWTEAGETELAITEWSRAGKAAEARSASKEALLSYQQALALLHLLPESPERDLREHELLQSVVGTLFLSRGYTAPETNEVRARGQALAEKSGNLTELVRWIFERGCSVYDTGDLAAANALADQAFELALRDGSPINLARVYCLQIWVRFSRGDLAGVEKHFTAGLRFFDDADFRQLPVFAISTFGIASWSAWILGRAELARERMAQMMGVVNKSNPFDVVWSGHNAAMLHLHMREPEQAEVLEVRTLEWSEKNQAPQVAAWSRGCLGCARAQLGRTAEGVALIRKGKAGLNELGSHIADTAFTVHLAEAQARDGAIAEALETVEQVLRANPDEGVQRPEALRLCGELRLKQGQSELAEADFRHSIGELRATMSFARLLDLQGKRDEARAMLADIYNWFTEGFDTADLKDAKAMLDELNR